MLHGDGDGDRDGARDRDRDVDVADPVVVVMAVVVMVVMVVRVAVSPLCDPPTIPVTCAAWLVRVEKTVVISITQALRRVAVS